MGGGGFIEQDAKHLDESSCNLGSWALEKPELLHIAVSRTLEANGLGSRVSPNSGTPI